MFKKKIIFSMLLVMQVNIEFAMMRKVTSKSPKISQSYLPNTFMTTQGMPKNVSELPKTSQAQFNRWLQEQNPELQQKIIKNDLFQEHMRDLAHPFKNDMALQQKIMIQQEILDYMMLHSQDAAEIIDFYVQTRDAQRLIQERLKLLPEHAQRFFKSQVKKHRGSNFFKGMNLTGLENIKQKILELNNNIFSALIIMLDIVVFTIVFIDNERLKQERIEENTLSYQKEVKDKFLLEVFSLILDALNLEPIPLVYLRPEDQFAASFAVYDMDTVIGLVALFPSFFDASMPVQVKILLHELRHHLQLAPDVNEHIVIPADVVQYAKECAVQPYGLDLFMQTGFFWTRAMIEFDADNFAQQQMKDSSFIKEIASFWQIPFEPNKGYLRGDMWFKDAPHAHRNDFLIWLENNWNAFVSTFTGENLYLKYIPEHLKQAAAKNRAAKAKIKPKTSGEKLFDSYLANLDQEFAGAVK